MSSGNDLFGLNGHTLYNAHLGVRRIAAIDEVPARSFEKPKIFLFGRSRRYPNSTRPRSLSEFRIFLQTPDICERQTGQRPHCQLVEQYQ
jgi:hypothetical protein